MDLDRLHDQYKNAQPFSHLVLDDFCDVAEDLFRDFPGPEEINWWKYQNFLEKKLACDKWELFPASIQNFIDSLHGSLFIRFLEKVSGITGLCPDSSLNGGGLHQITRGGKLDIHCDYNYHPVTKLDRRLNVILYLNPDWKPEWGGCLELWDKEMSHCVTSISPVFNRLVIFSTTDTSFHGHPDPLNCPEDVTRKSIALYYYSNGRPDHERSEPHSTIFKKRPQDIETPEQAEFRQKRSVKRL